MKLFSVFLLIFVGIGYCFSQAIQWKSINGIADVWQISEGANGKLFALTTQSGGMQSTDDGHSWSMNSTLSGEIREFASHGQIQVIRKNVGGILNWDQVYMSTDNGITWNRILGSRGGYDYYTISDSGIVYAIYSNYNGAGVVRFNGIQWDTIGSKIQLPLFYPGGFLIDHSNNFIIWAYQYYSDVYISTDLGQTWNRRLVDQTISAGCIGPNNELIAGVSNTSSESRDGGIYLSTDQGTNWTDLGLKDQTINSIMTNSVGNVYVATGVFNKSDGGIYCYKIKSQSWDDISPENNRFTTLFVTTSGTLFTASGLSYRITPTNVLYRSSDQGVFWSPSGPNAAEIFSLFATSRGSLLAGTLGDRIFKSPDNGVSWYQLSPGSVGDYVYSFAQKDSMQLAGTNDGLFLSTDDGDNWRNLTEHKFGGSAYSVVIESNGTILAGTNFGVYLSNDSGKNWNQSGLANSKILFMANSPSDVVYAATENDGVFSSTNYGTRWISKGLVRNDIQTIEVNSDGNIYVGVYGGIFKSTDGGNSWAQSIFTNTYVYSLTFQGPTDVYAGTYSGLYCSSNAGLNWSLVGFAGQTILAIKFDLQSNLIAGLYSGGVYMSTQPVTSVEMLSSELPQSTALQQNYPNPFNPTTKIKFQIPNVVNVRLSVYDVLGRELEVLINEIKPPGVYSVSWDGSNYSSGLYFSRLKVGNRIVDVKKMLLLR